MKRIMNKQTIITILLALVAMTGQGQVKSGLNLCLRDVVTDNWLVEEFARIKNIKLKQNN